jgi:hypothetical protein
MRKLLFIAFACLLSANLFSQSNKEDIAIIQAMFGKEKKALVEEYMTFPENKKTKFWTLYDEYEDARKKLGRDRIEILGKYADEYATLDDKKATELMNKKLNWADSYSKFQRDYFTRFSAVIGALQASKFMQLEDYLENNIRLAIQEQIPFIGELDKTRVPDTKQ